MARRAVGWNGLPGPRGQLSLHEYEDIARAKHVGVEITHRDKSFAVIAGVQALGLSVSSAETVPVVIQPAAGGAPYGCHRVGLGHRRSAVVLDAGGREALTVRPQRRHSCQR